MVAVATHPMSLNPFVAPSLFFAREPEPDLDFDEDLDELEDDSPSGGYSPRGPRKKSGRSVLMWVFLLVLVAGGGYLAMEPNLVMEMMGPLLGETTPPPVALQTPSTPPVKAATQAQNALAPGNTIPTMAPASAVPSPQFREGQRVSVILDPATPGGPLSLYGNPAGTQPGPTVSPGSTLTVTDGALEKNTWVYSVQTNKGAVGWIAENRLMAKP